MDEPGRGRGALPLTPIFDGRAVGDLALSMSWHPSAPAYAAAAGGTIGLATLVDPRAPFPGRQVKLVARVGAPLLVIVAAGPVHTAGDPPAAWLCARRLAAWARHAAVHVSPEADDYEAAIVAAVQLGRAVLVEASDATAPAWLEYLSRLGQAGLAFAPTSIRGWQ
jgi:hypothetical protein